MAKSKYASATFHQIYKYTSLAFQKALNVISLVSINFTELVVHEIIVLFQEGSWEL
jgi:hypothetical protein